MLTDMLKDLIPHYEQTLRNIANHHKFVLKDIHNEYERIKTGRNAFLVHKNLLYAQLRHIGGLQFKHIIVTRELSPTSNSEYCHRLYKEMCYSFLYAAEAYTKEKRYKVGIRCWNNFKQIALTSDLGNKGLVGTLRRIKENCSNLKTSVDDYCRQTNIYLRDLKNEVF